VKGHAHPISGRGNSNIRSFPTVLFYAFVLKPTGLAGMTKKVNTAMGLSPGKLESEVLKLQEAIFPYFPVYELKALLYQVN
jgi:hypothetical protein